MLQVENIELKVKGIKKSYSFIHTSDAHIAYAYPNEPESERELAKVHTKKWQSGDITPYEYFSDLIDYTNESDVDGLIIAGDCVDYISEGCFKYIKDKFDTLNKDLLYVYGNHESARYYDHSDHFEHYPDYAPLMHGDPSFWVKDYGDLLVVGLDNSYGKERIKEAHIAKLKEQCARNIPILLIMHIPITTESNYETIKNMWGNDAYFFFGTEEDAPLSREFASFVMSENNNIAAIFAGHEHLSHNGEFSFGRMQFISAPTYKGCIKKVTLIPE